MKSTCPACLSQVNHSDGDLQVRCDCGHSFSPFMDASAPPDPGAFSSPAMTPSDAGGFDESKAAFQDIVDFGENIGTPEETPVTPPIPAHEKKAVGGGSVSPLPGGILCTAGTSFEGLKIQSHLPPISLWTEVGTEGNPLGKGIQSLWGLATSQGANGLIGLSFSLVADGTRALLVATPVKCSQNA